jgi:hypothetical protein
VPGVGPLHDSGHHPEQADRDVEGHRPDGNDQYIRPTDLFAHYLDDPYTPVVVRGAGWRPDREWPWYTRNERARPPPRP